MMNTKRSHGEMLNTQKIRNLPFKPLQITALCISKVDQVVQVPFSSLILRLERPTFSRHVGAWGAKGEKAAENRGAVTVKTLWGLLAARGLEAGHPNNPGQLALVLMVKHGQGYTKQAKASELITVIMKTIPRYPAPIISITAAGVTANRVSKTDTLLRTLRRCLKSMPSESMANALSLAIVLY